MVSVAVEAELTVVAEAITEGELPEPEGAPPWTGELLEVLSSGEVLEGTTEETAIGVVAPLL